MRESIAHTFRESFCSLLHEWYGKHMRPLPWRLSPSPYRIWISEIMLQQTQMERGVERFLSWMNRFPTLESLGKASEEEVLKLWEGLGYYSRARNILKTARLLVSQNGTKLPQNAEELKKLPGIGSYTAAAIASTAHQEHVACVDANVVRLIARLLRLEEQQPALLATVQGIADELLCDHPGEHNQAMMELGALVCTPKSPSCPTCPLQRLCKAKISEVASLYPVKPEKQERLHMENLAVILRLKGRFLVQKRLEQPWKGLWEFPCTTLQEQESKEKGAGRILLEIFGRSIQYRESRRLDPLRHGYTNHAVTLHAMLLEAEEEGCPPLPNVQKELLWCSVGELEELAMPSPHRKLAGCLRLKGMVQGSLLDSLPSIQKRKP